MSVFGGDITEDILNSDDLNRNIDENELPGGSDVEQNDEEDQMEPVKVEMKKRSVRNPQLRLTVDTLKGPRGLHTIEKHFDGIQFRGKGYEKTDLNEILRRIQHWAHRLFPKYTFDDVITNVDRLSKKKALQVHMSRYRLDQLEPEFVRNTDGDMEENGELMAPQDEPFDEFDALLNEQIAVSKLAPKTPSSSSRFNNTSLASSAFHTPKLNQKNVVMSTPFPITEEQETLADPLPSSPPKLSSEQMAQIAENRRIAQERLKAKKALLSQSNL